MLLHGGHGLARSRTWTGAKDGEFGIRLEENVVVKKDGYELLTRWPVDQITECLF